MKKHFTTSDGYRIINEWMHNKSMVPFSYQEKTWKSYAHGHSGMVVAPTGFGKTFSVFLAVLIDFMNRPEKYPKGLKLLWITPLRSLSKDISKAMETTINEIGLDWTVRLRNGDVSQAEKQKQNRNMPDVLVITPESLHLMLSQKAKTRFFKNLKCIAVDEWHELMGSKRGVMVELAVAHLRSFAYGVRVWGLTSTIGNLDDALEVLVPWNEQRKKIVAREKKKTQILSVFPDELEILPWAGHMGSKMVDKILPIIARSKTTLIFTNTRAQAETWYMNLLEADTSLAGLIAIHHSSIDANLRIWIEDNLASGYLKAVVCASSLDLGIDFKPADTVIQIGSSKGVARFLQRTGRSGHSPFETSKIYFVPTHSLELIEPAALKEAHRLHSVEKREPLFLSFDVLVQFMVTLALGEGFYEKELKAQVKSTFAFAEMARRKFRDIAVISGLVVQNFPSNQQKFKNIQASSNLIFKVPEEHEPDHFLVRQAYTEVFNSQIEETRLRHAFNRITESRIVFKKLERFTPLSFPIKVDSLRQSLSSEKLISRIERMKKSGSGQKKNKKLQTT